MAAVSAHPLDPLGADEIRAAAAILRRDHDVGDRWRIASIELREPSKDVVREHRAGDPIAREATVICWNRDDGRVYKARVDLARDRTTAWDHVPDGQPNMTVDEFTECDAALRRDPRVIKALADRGITDIDRVLIDTWAYGAHLVPEQHRGGRIGWADVWYRKQPGSSPYANPVTGLHFVVDLNRMELLEVEDDHRVEEPETMGEYVPHLVPGLRLRDDVERLEITQPEGPSYTVDGHLVRWQKWSVRVGFNHREGMVLHTLAYDGRPVAHRLSFAEMVVPYRDPTTDHYRRTAFDVGEWGLGFMTTSLELGCDCLGEIAYLDAVMHDTKGEPYTIRNAICIHEEDDAILWKHVDAVTGAETRRSRRLVLSFHVTVANYEYLVYWRLYQDGNVECEVRATGIMVTTHFAPGEQPPYGTLVDQRTYAPFHQHFLVARLDLDVDGEANSVYMTRVRGAAGRPRQPARARARPARDAAGRRSARGCRTTTGARSARGRSSTSASPTSSARRSATSSCPAAASRRCWTPARRCSPARRRSATRCGSRRSTRTSAGRAASSSSRAATTAACPRGRPPTARSMTPTSCSGTCSGSTTSPARRSGR